MDAFFQCLYFVDEFETNLHQKLPHLIEESTIWMKYMITVIEYSVTYIQSKEKKNETKTIVNMSHKQPFFSLGAHMSTSKRKKIPKIHFVCEIVRKKSYEIFQSFSWPTTTTIPSLQLPLLLFFIRSHVLSFPL